MHLKRLLKAGGSNWNMLFYQFLHHFYSDSCVWHLTKAFSFSIQPNFRAQQDIFNTVTFQSLCSMNFSWTFFVIEDDFYFYFSEKNYSDPKCIMAGQFATVTSATQNVNSLTLTEVEERRDGKDAALFCVSPPLTN